MICKIRFSKHEMKHWIIWIQRRHRGSLFCIRLSKLWQLTCDRDHPELMWYLYYIRHNFTNWLNMLHNRWKRDMRASILSEAVTIWTNGAWFYKAMKEHIFFWEKLLTRFFLESQFDQSNHFLHLWSAKMKKICSIKKKWISVWIQFLLNLIL